jgi:hypothetical protein
MFIRRQQQRLSWRKLANFKLTFTNFVCFDANFVDRATDNITAEKISYVRLF